MTQEPFKIGTTGADFAETGIDRIFIIENFGGKKRANESILSTIEKATEWMLWKRSLIDSLGTCSVVFVDGVVKTSREDRDKVEWTGSFVVLKGNERKGIGKSGTGQFSVWFEEGRGDEMTLKDAFLKVYKKDRDAMEKKCFEK